MADIFDEVAEDLRAARAMALARRYGVWVALVLVLAAVGAGGWQAWRWRQAAQSAQAATQFIAAMNDSEGAAATAAASTPARQAALDGFSRLASADSPAGYRTLARLRLAALKADGNDLPGALALWDQVSADGAADPLLRDLARLMWVERQVDGGDAAALDARLAPLLAGDNPWRALAQEAGAWISLRTGQADKAKETLRRLANDVTAPEGVRGRASGLLAQLGDPVPSRDGRTLGAGG